MGPRKVTCVVQATTALKTHPHRGVIKNRLASTIIEHSQSAISPPRVNEAHGFQKACNEDEHMAGFIGLKCCLSPFQCILSRPPSIFTRPQSTLNLVVPLPEGEELQVHQTREYDDEKRQRHQRCS